MAITIPRGFSVSLPVSVTDGPDAVVDDATALTNVKSDDPAAVRVVYPDPTASVANPARSVRVDAIGSIGAGTNLHATFTSPLDGTIRNIGVVASVAVPPNNGAASFGTPSTPFKTPAG